MVTVRVVVLNEGIAVCSNCIWFGCTIISTVCSSGGGRDSSGVAIVIMVIDVVVMVEVVIIIVEEVVEVVVEVEEVVMV